MQISTLKWGHKEVVWVQHFDEVKKSEELKKKQETTVIRWTWEMLQPLD